MNHEQVRDRTSFAAYVAQLRAEVDVNETARDWKNTDLRSFLGAMQHWAEDWTEPADINPWRHAADVLTAALVYE